MSMTSRTSGTRRLDRAAFRMNASDCENDCQTEPGECRFPWLYRRSIRDFKGFRTNSPFSCFGFVLRNTTVLRRMLSQGPCCARYRLLPPDFGPVLRMVPGCGLRSKLTGLPLRWTAESEVSIRPVDRRVFLGF